MTVFGTRPEAIKMAPLVLELSRHPEIEPICCVTAQHREMLDSVLDIFKIKPDYDLNIMAPRQTLASITTKILNGLDGVLDEAKPDIVLVHGDTSTTFASSLCAFYHGISVGHVEAGLRSFDKYSPFPEEINRKLTGNIADLHFCPTINNANNLKRESIDGEVFITGNTVIDALKTTVKDNYTFHSEALADIDFDSYRTILLTAHRRENYGEPMENIMNAVKTIVETHPDCQVIYPVHLSPAVRDTVFPILSGVDRVHLIDPIDVDDMHNLMARSHLILTDSGGLQEEAPSLGKPVLVLRCETERPEAVDAGTVKIAGVKYDDIVALTNELLDNDEAYDEMAHAVNPYGDGNASARIAQAIIWKFNGTCDRPENFNA
ncbi:MAG: UDP-N-acetylglucosamine 2-epimerase (non-hydrolyzing) [Clostridia bacterium]|nr:UDP-N-acetylglucosamine 2-epimerase (non-hydrolyzing) [Clostridia bacterium]